MLQIDLRSVPSILEKLDSTLLDRDGKIKLLPAEFYKQIDRQDFRVWCHFRARYLIPTVELVQWLKDRIGCRTAIEIGAGNADLGFHLGIRSTDSYCQQFPHVKSFYIRCGQVPTCPSDFVEKIEAVDAIVKYRPQVVIGAWITEKYTAVKQTGNMYAPDDLVILQNTDEYIHIGCHKEHGTRETLALPHETFEFPWIVSRVSDPIDDAIHCWTVDTP